MICPVSSSGRRPLPSVAWLSFMAVVAPNADVDAVCGKLAAFVDAKGGATP